MTIICIDPGKDKCGIAVMESAVQVIDKTIIPRKQLMNNLVSLTSTYPSAKIIIGNSHHGRQIAGTINLAHEFVDETFSSLLARSLYWKEHPPKGLWRFIPQGLRIPPVKIDDYAAVILGQRYFNR